MTFRVTACLPLLMMLVAACNSRTHDVQDESVSSTSSSKVERFVIEEETIVSDISSGPSIDSGKDLASISPRDFLSASSESIYRVLCQRRDMHPQYVNSKPGEVFTRTEVKFAKVWPRSENAYHEYYLSAGYIKKDDRAECHVVIMESIGEQNGATSTASMGPIASPRADITSFSEQDKQDVIEVIDEFKKRLETQLELNSASVD